MINALLLCTCFLIIAITNYVFRCCSTKIVTEISFTDVASEVKIKTLYVNLSHKEYIEHISELKSQQEAKRISGVEIIDYIK